MNEFPCTRVEKAAGKRLRARKLPAGQPQLLYRDYVRGLPNSSRGFVRAVQKGPISHLGSESPMVR